MSAAEALKVAREAGLEISVDGQDLALKAPSPPPPAILDLLSRHKAGVIAILCAGREDWPAEEWRALYDERAAIAEFEGGLSREDAEALAHACCVAEWLNRNPVCSSPGNCIGCGQGEQPHEPLLPFGNGAEGHVWLHHRCWDEWHMIRKAHAVGALAAIGIQKRSRK